MRYSDLTKSLNKKTLVLLEREDKQAGSPAASPVVSGQAGADGGAAIPSASAAAARDTVSGGAGPRLPLNDTQRAEAALVEKLPSDFPFDQWDKMPTKAQLLTMQFSGLTETEQWRLLNASTPLGALAVLKKIQDGAAAKTIQSQEAILLAERAVQLAAERKRLTDGDASILPSLQKEVLDRQLKKEEAALKSAVTGAPKGTPVSTPNPSSPPLPQPGPAPVKTPEVKSAINPDKQEVFMDLSAATKNVISYLLDIDKNVLSTGDRKILEVIERRIDNGKLTRSQLRLYLQDINRIRTEVEKIEYLDKVKSSSKKEATWGTEIIHKQSEYSSASGSFGKFGSLSKNGCGFIALHNANQILGNRTKFSDLYLGLQQNPSTKTNFFGWLGMNPKIVSEFYEQQGATVSHYKDLASVPKTHDAYIALFFHSSGAHYVAAVYDETAHQFMVYNLFDTGSSPLSDLSAEAYAQRAGKTSGWQVWGIDTTESSSAHTYRSEIR